MEKKQVEVNYLYFGAFLALLLATSAAGIIMKEDLAGSRIFFFLYAAGQSIFETLALIFLSWIIQTYLGALSAAAFIGATFFFLTLHFLDFLLDRILDISVWEAAISFIIHESWGNFLLLLDASGVPIWIWFFGFGIVIAIPFFGIALHAWTHRMIADRPLRVRQEWLFQAFLCIPAALLFWDFSASPTLRPDSYTSLIKSLPWKATFLQPKGVHYPLTALLFEPKPAADIVALIAADTTMLAKKPNIYLFVIESFREDFIDSQVAPNLASFKEKSHHFDLALSNANGTHPSWFSIFHSQFSHFWSSYQANGWTMGAPPIQLLKKWGYKTRVYTSAQLKYYKMEELLFGSEFAKNDSYQTFLHSSYLTAADTDAQALLKWQSDLKEESELQEGQLVIFFLDSTHFGYSWPKNWKLAFTPISNGADYFNIFHSKGQIDKIKNRYRNSVQYIDSLFGSFFDQMPDKENAIVIVTGDHGEEFFEHGHLFHGSHLSHEQTNIPLYMYFGSKSQDAGPKVVSQMDIFPSVLHHLSGQAIPFLEGSSIFSENRWPFVVISRFNAGRPSYEFCIHNGKSKLIAQFNDRTHLSHSTSLRIRSLKDSHDRCLFNCDQSDLQGWVQKEFGPAIDRLFSRPQE